MKKETNAWEKFISQTTNLRKVLQAFVLVSVLMAGSYAPAMAADIDEALQGKSISGTISDASGSTLPGVTIVEKGTTNGSITDIDRKSVV